jgi:hypothetical protein
LLVTSSDGLTPPSSSGRSIEELSASGRSIEELSASGRSIEELSASGRSIEELSASCAFSFHRFIAFGFTYLGSGATA